MPAKTAAEKTATICPTCQNGDHTDCRAQGGNWVCVCDNADHPDAGTRALHAFDAPAPDLGPPADPHPDEPAPLDVEPDVTLKQGVHVEQGRVIEDEGDVIEGDVINEGA